MFNVFLLVSLILIVQVTAFTMKNPAVLKSFVPSNTKLFEDFNLDFKNPTIISSKEIFTEKQLREYTASYSVDERFNILQFILNIFKKPEEEESSGKSVIKPTISVSALEEKTSQYVKGKIDAKNFYSTLTTAFGNKLPAVLPEILSNLPKDKANALSKIAK